MSSLKKGKLLLRQDMHGVVEKTVDLVERGYSVLAIGQRGKSLSASPPSLVVCRQCLTAM